MKIQKNSLLAVALIVLLFSAGYFNLFNIIFGLDSPKAVALSIFLIAAFLWVTEWLPLYLTSFLILFLQISWLLPVINPLAGKTDRMPYMQAFFCDITLLFMGGFVLASVLHKYRLDNRIAFLLLRQTGKSPTKILLGMMIISALLSMWMSNTATTAMMFAIILPIVKEIPESNTFSKGLALSIPFACNLGGLATPIGTPPNAIAMNYLVEKGIAISFGEWMLATVPFMLVFLLLSWVLLLKMYPPGDLEINLQAEDSGRMTAVHWLIITLFLCTIVGWFSTNIHGLSIGTVSLIPVIVAFGLGLLKLPDFKLLPWDVLFMVGGGICLGVGLKSSGLTQHVVGLIPVQLNFCWVLIIFGCLGALMTTFMSNTATANLLIPIAISMDNNVSLLVITLAMVCSTAMALPVSTPPNAIAFGSGMLRAKDMIWPGAIISVVSLIIILAIGFLYWPLLGIY